MIELPWPPAKLSPNGSHGSHWARASAARKYRGECLLLIRSQSLGWRETDGHPIMLDIRFHPPTKRLSDLDNLLSRAKHGIDALAEVMGVNDQRFEFTLRRGEPVKGGAVRVMIA